MECIRTFIAEALGVQLDLTHLQHVHRAPVSIPEDNHPPRPVIIRFLSFLEREWVIQTENEKYRKNETIIWKDCKLSFSTTWQKKLQTKGRNLWKPGRGYMSWMCVLL